jgi:hypothetical protein
MAKVVAKAGLEESADGFGKRLAAAPERVDLRFDVSRDPRGLAMDRLGLEEFFLFLLFYRLAV